MLAINVLAVVSLSLFGTGSAQVYFKGPACPSNVNVMPKFRIQKFVGTWYEHEKYPIVGGMVGKCVKLQFSTGSGGSVLVTMGMVIGADVQFDISGNGNQIAPGKLRVNFPESPVFNATSDYWILDTDYTSYSVAYSCQAMKKQQHAISVWILTREQKPSATLVNSARDVLVENGVSLNELVKTEQTVCKSTPQKPRYC